MNFKNKYQYIGLFILGIFAIFYSQYYTITNEVIKKSPWKCGDGNIGMGDLIWFKNIGHNKDYYHLKGDSIVYKNKNIAVITKRGYRIIGGNYLIIKSLSTHDTATYHEK